MTNTELEAFCIGAYLNRAHSVTLTLPKKFKPNAGFPRGQLLSVNSQGEKNCSYDPLKLLAWMRTQWAVT